MNKRLLLDKDRLQIASFVLISLIVLLIPGMINLKMTHSQPTVTESMLLGSSSGLPIYFNAFIFPTQIQFPSDPIQATHFIDSSSLFPLTFKVIQATSKNVYGSDTVTIEYTGNEKRTVFSCNGTPLEPQQTIKSIYYIDGFANLACADLIENTPVLSNAQILIKNIDAMRILYGLDPDKDGNANQYLSSHEHDFSLAKLITMRVNLLLRTYEKTSPQTKYYTLGDQRVGPYEDGYVRKTLTLIFPLTQ